MYAWGQISRLVPLALVMSQLQRTSPVVLLARVQEALLNATPGIEVATASEGDCGMFVAAGSVKPSEHEARRIVRAMLCTMRVVRNIWQLAFRGRVRTK
jgi:precorrin-3B methylase